MQVPWAEFSKVSLIGRNRFRPLPGAKEKTAGASHRGRHSHGPLVFQQKFSGPYVEWHVPSFMVAAGDARDLMSQGSASYVLFRHVFLWQSIGFIELPIALIGEVEYAYLPGKSGIDRIPG